MCWVFWRRGGLFSAALACQDDLSLCFTHMSWSSPAALSQACSEKPGETSSLQRSSPARGLWAQESGSWGLSIPVWRRFARGPQAMGPASLLTVTLWHFPAAAAMVASPLRPHPASHESRGLAVAGPGSWVPACFYPQSRRDRRRQRPR